jgi:hypothetical protein
MEQLEQFKLNLNTIKNELTVLNTEVKHQPQNYASRLPLLITKTSPNSWQKGTANPKQAIDSTITSTK